MDYRKIYEKIRIYEEKSIYIDEAWTMLKYEETANFIEQLARSARKRGVRLVLASQMAEEFTASTRKSSLKFLWHSYYNETITSKC